MNKQDLNGYRKPEEVVRRFDLSKIELNSDDIEKLKQEVICDDHLSTSSKAPVQNKVITDALSHKVNKVNGKGLSTNDFTNEDKEILEEITATKITNWDNLVTLFTIGFIYLSTNNTAPTIEDMTFTSVGTITVGTETIYVYKRTS